MMNMCDMFTLQVLLDDVFIDEKWVLGDQNDYIYDILCKIDSQGYLPLTFQIPLECWDKPILKGYNDTN